MELLLILVALAVVALLGAAAENFGIDSRDPQSHTNHAGVR
jgi:Tfp pilus assembly protein FimT